MSHGLLEYYVRKFYILVFQNSKFLMHRRTVMKSRTLTEGHMMSRSAYSGRYRVFYIIFLVSFSYEFTLHTRIYIIHSYVGYFSPNYDLKIDFVRIVTRHWWASSCDDRGIWSMLDMRLSRLPVLTRKASWRFENLSYCKTSLCTELSSIPKIYKFYSKQAGTLQLRVSNP